MGKKQVKDSEEVSNSVEVQASNDWLVEGLKYIVERSGINTNVYNAIGYMDDVNKKAKELLGKIV